MYQSLQDFGDNWQYGNRAIVSCITFISTFMNRCDQRVFPVFWVYLDAICNMFTLIPSGPVAFPIDIDDICFWTYSSVISGSVHFSSSELMRVKRILSSTKPRGVALLTKRSPTVEKCSLNISAMSARSSTTSPCWERREFATIFCLLGRTSLSFFHITDEFPLFSSMVDVKCSLFLLRICSVTEFRSFLYTSQLFCEPERFAILCATNMFGFHRCMMVNNTHKRRIPYWPCIINIMAVKDMFPWGIE